MEPKIDLSNLARMMLRWERLQLQVDELRGAIEDTVMQIKRTQTAGNVRAVYSGGRKSYDYREAADGHPMVNTATVELFTVMPPPQTDWRKVCDHAGIEKDEILFTQSDPSVRVKLLPAE